MDTNIRTTTIGVTAATPGGGATHCAVLCATFLSAVMGFRVALTHLTQKDCLRQAEMIHNSLNPRKIIQNKISIYGQPGDVSVSELVTLTGEERFQYVVIDFGYYRNFDRQSFLLCNVKLAVGSLSWWKLPFYAEFLEQIKMRPESRNWEFLGTGAIPAGVSYLKQEYGIFVRAVPQEPDPFLLHKDSLHFWQELTGKW